MDPAQFADDPNAAIDELLSAPTPITWRINPNDPDRTLDASEAERTWVELRQWVDWLIERYALDSKTVPPCWYFHGALVDELTALWGAWQIAYWPMGSSADPANWMQIFANTRVRLIDWTGRRGCRPGEHNNDRPQPPADDAEQWAHHIAADREHRTSSYTPPAHPPK